MIFLAAAWYLASPHLTPGNGLSVGSLARIFATEIELMFYGEAVWSPPFRLATFATASVAAIAAVSMATWYAMTGFQWVGERARAAAPAKSVNKLSDAAWASRADVVDRFSTPGGIVLGELTDPRRKVRFDPAVPRRWGRQGKGPLITLDPSAGNAHSLVFSGSGSFKTAGIAIPNALTFAGSLIVIDPKGEIHAATSAVRSARERNPWLVTEKDGLDPIRLLTAARPNDGTVFDSVAEFLLPTSGDDKIDSSAFFHQKAVRLVSALLAHLHYTAPEGTDLFMEANRILALAPDVLKALFAEAAEEHEKYQDREFIHVGLSEVGNTEPRQLSGVTATAANGLSWAGHSATRGFLVSKRADGKPADGKHLLARVLDDKTDIYFRIPTPILQANPGIARVLIGSLVRVLRDSAMEADRMALEGVNSPEATIAGTRASSSTAPRRSLAGLSKDGSKEGERPSERKPRSRRLFLIDEARAMRRMDTLAAVRDEGRAYGIHLLQIFQSWQQVLECYGQHGAGAWANSVDAVVIGPVSDARQAQELSRMVGRHTVVTSSTSRQRNAQIFMPFSGTAGSSESTQLRELDLIQPSELRQLPPEAAIILAVGTAPIMASKAIWFTRADMTKIVAEAKTSSNPENPPGEAPDPVTLDASDTEDATASTPGIEDRPSRELAKEQGVSDIAVSCENAGDPLDAVAGQGRFPATVDSAGGGADDGAVAGTENPPGDTEEDVVDSSGVAVVSPDPASSAPAPPDMNKGAGVDPTGGDAEDLPADDCRETGDDGDAANASEIDEKAFEEGGGGEESAEPETGQASSSSAMDAVASGIVNHAVYSAIIQRSHPIRSHPFVDAVLNRPDVTIPPGTDAKVILPLTLGRGVDHADSWSLVFVPKDGHSPIHRIVIDTDGTIVARCGPYRSGA